MNIIKRIATSVHAGVEFTVASIENHGALVQATLKDQQRAVAKATVKLRRLESTEQRQKENIARLNQRIETWTTRAKSIGESDKEKALDCLVQRQADQRLLDIAVKEQLNHSNLTARMQEKVTELQQRVSDMQTQYTDMQMRDTVADATSKLDDLERLSGANINDTFERWEISLEAREMQNNLNTNTSHTPLTLDEEFTREENQQALKNELETLLKTTP